MKYITDENIDSVKVQPLWWQLRGLMYTATGYGKKIPTQYMIKLSHSKTWNRVYTRIYSNSGTNYVIHKGTEWIVDQDLRDFI